MLIHVTYNSYHESGGKTLTNEEWSDRSDSYYSFEVTGAFSEGTTPPGPNFETVPSSIPEQYTGPIWIVWVRYGDGDTFGHSSGHGRIEGAFLLESDANQLCKNIESSGENYKSVHGYNIWDGYFNSLKGIHTEQFLISTSRSQ